LGFSSRDLNRCQLELAIGFLTASSAVTFHKERLAG